MKRPKTLLIAATLTFGISACDSTTSPPPPKTPAPVVAIAVGPESPTVSIGSSIQLQATTTDSAGNLLGGRPVQWRTHDPLIAVVNQSGIVTGAGEGTVAIYATSEGRTASTVVFVRRSTAGRTLLFSSSAGTPDYQDGNSLYVNIPDIFVAREDGSDTVNITSHRAWDGEASWSPDGRQIVFTSTRDGNFDLYTMGDDGRDVRRVTTSAEPDRDGRWSPDGRRIVFWSTRDEVPLQGTETWKPSDIFAVDPDGSNLVNLTRTPNAQESQPVWSPDGTKIGYLRVQYEIHVTCVVSPCRPQPFPVAQQFYVMNADGSNQRVLFEIDPNFVPDAFAWSPDGTRVAYSAYNKKSPAFSDQWVIFIANADGSNTRQRTLSGMARFPSWSPDGTRLFYSFSGEEYWAKLYTGTGILDVDGPGGKTVFFDIREHTFSDSPAAWRK
jgi:Tol biopolymer transport system component